MTVQRPGGFEITERGLDIAGYKKGSRILDIGCGGGDTVNYLNEQGFQAEGIDINLSKIGEAKEAFPGINVKFGDGGFMDDYMSFTFDGIMMECTLNAIVQPDEALHEVYCVMKKGGRLIISDFYEIDPDPNQLKAVAIEAARRARLPHNEGDCDEGTPEHFVSFKFGGAFYKEPLIRYIEEEVGLRVMAFEDQSDKLEEGYESFGKDLDTKTGRKIGYFLLVAQKPL